MSNGTFEIHMRIVWDKQVFLVLCCLLHFRMSRMPALCSVNASWAFLLLRVPEKPHCRFQKVTSWRAITPSKDSWPRPTRKRSLLPEGGEHYVPLAGVFPHRNTRQWKMEAPLALRRGTPDITHTASDFRELNYYPKRETGLISF